MRRGRCRRRTRRRTRRCGGGTRRWHGSGSETRVPTDALVVPTCRAKPGAISGDPVAVLGPLSVALYRYLAGRGLGCGVKRDLLLDIAVLANGALRLTAGSRVEEVVRLRLLQPDDRYQSGRLLR